MNIFEYFAEYLGISGQSLRNDWIINETWRCLKMLAQRLEQMLRLLTWLVHSGYVQCAIIINRRFNVCSCWLVIWNVVSKYCPVVISCARVELICQITPFFDPINWWIEMRDEKAVPPTSRSEVGAEEIWAVYMVEVKSGRELEKLSLIFMAFDRLTDQHPF